MRRLQKRSRCLRQRLSFTVGGAGWYKINTVIELRYLMGTRNGILRKFHSIIFLRFPGNILYIYFHLYHKTFTDAQLKNKYLTSIDTTVASKILQIWVTWHSSTLSRDSQQVAAHSVASVQHRIIRILIGRSWCFMYNRQYLLAGKTVARARLAGKGGERAVVNVRWFTPSHFVLGQYQGTMVLLRT